MVGVPEKTLHRALPHLGRHVDLDEVPGQVGALAQVGQAPQQPLQHRVHNLHAQQDNVKSRRSIKDAFVGFF